MRLDRAIARAFVAEGTREVFGVMGDGNAHWMLELGEHPEVRVNSTRHEAAALTMADGYARSTGAVGIATVTEGPGLTHLATSLVSAARNHVPVVIYAGDIPSTPWSLYAHIHGLDQRRFVESCEAVYRRVVTLDNWQHVVQGAFADARRLRRPVVLAVPMDLQRAEVDPPDDYRPTAETMVEYRATRPDSAAIAEAAQALATASRPVIVAGRGATDPATRQLLTRLADLGGAILANTLPAKGMFDDHEFGVGIVGGFSSGIGEELISSADLVLAFGASLNVMTSGLGRLLAAPTVFGFGNEVPSWDGRRIPDVFIEGDCREAAAAIIDAMPAQPREGYRTADVRARLAAETARLQQVRASAIAPDDGLLDPRQVMVRLDAALPADAAVVSGTGHFWDFVTTYLQGAASNSFLFSDGFASIGLSLPTAIGAAVASPDRCTIMFEGDGSFMQNVQEIDTAVRLGLRLVMVVIDDEGLGAEYQKLQAMGLDARQSLLPSPDFVGLAGAMGAAGETVRTLEQLDAAFARAIAADGPYLLDVKTSRSVMSDFFSQAFGDLPNTSPSQNRAWKAGL